MDTVHYQPISWQAPFQAKHAGAEPLRCLSFFPAVVGWSFQTVMFCVCTFIWFICIVCLSMWYTSIVGLVSSQDSNFAMFLYIVHMYDTWVGICPILPGMFFWQIPEWDKQPTSRLFEVKVPEDTPGKTHKNQEGFVMCSVSCYWLMKKTYTYKPLQKSQYVSWFPRRRETMGSDVQTLEGDKFRWFLWIEVLDVPRHD